MKPSFLTIGLLYLVLACGSDPETATLTNSTIEYPESAVDFPNPERGFYHYSESRASSYNPLNLSTLRNYRNSQAVSGATYPVVSTLVFRYFVLDIFKNSALTTDYINKVKNDFSVARNAGVKLVVRFTYTVTSTAGSCPEGFICPPYGDAPKNIVLEHISQLAPVLTENADVIACLQMGFIGTWGEQYYTDYFGDASSNGQSKLLDNNWQDRIDVLKALLDATPKEIMVQVRYPQIKQRLIYGINAPVTSAALTEAEAFSGLDKARIAYHNDCLLASTDDFGTYEDYGNSSSPRVTANATLRAYFSADSKYLVVGGETCSDGYSPQNDCEPAGKAEMELSDMHYSFLNTAYNNQVNNDWVTGGCMENIKKKLGYRFVLKNGKFPNQLEQGENLTVALELDNIGYASPYKYRPVQLILKNKTTQATVVKEFTTDIRKWFTGAITLTESFALDAPAGEWELFLNLPDNNTSINTRPEYSIQLANEGVWSETTGHNSLKHTIIIK
ncbi:MAG: DUF4832 domain-containing protein [Cytophagales bacterium]|nr:DUF4832 domain-containing protein [Cytophagales bacterium]